VTGLERHRADPHERFRAVVTAAEAILEVATEPKDKP
jgi:hypothetical protein